MDISTMFRRCFTHFQIIFGRKMIKLLAIWRRQEIIFKKYHRSFTIGRSTKNFKIYETSYENRIQTSFLNNLKESFLSLLLSIFILFDYIFWFLHIKNCNWSADHSRKLWTVDSLWWVFENSILKLFFFGVLFRTNLYT